MSGKIALQELVDLVIDNNPALTAATGIDPGDLKSLAHGLISLVAGSKEEDKEHGEFFLLQWPGGDDQSGGLLPLVRARFLSRTCALDMAKMLNDQKHPDFKVGEHFDVASVSWLVEYAQLLGKRAGN